ncbi:hypothetical protein [Acinetobacter sp.]|uniref:hypothetical protein n=1 Tax=Acinetobacter sp. TaxID=472 RepID=UPI0028A02444|nr:hypothetical protein [Acinetobacter sp.]
MSEFEKWFIDQEFYTNMRFIHGDKLFNRDGDVYRILPVQMTYRAWCSQHVMTKEQYIALTQEWHTKGWNARQGEIDELKAQLNNMEQCYIQAKKKLEDAIYLKDEHRKRRCQLARELTRKSLRLTDAEFEYKRIKGLQAKDCLQIMRLTARNEKLSDEVKALRGEHE